MFKIVEYENLNKDGKLYSFHKECYLFGIKMFKHSYKFENKQGFKVEDKSIGFSQKGERK